jgi:hypothetical protein
MGFCAFCKVVVDPNIECCVECRNLRFRFLTGRRHQNSLGDPPGRVVGHFDPIPPIEYSPHEGDIRYYDAEDERSWMEYIDTRTEETWWEQFDET